MVKGNEFGLISTPCMTIGVARNLNNISYIFVRGYKKGMGKKVFYTFQLDELLDIEPQLENIAQRIEDGFTLDEKELKARAYALHQLSPIIKESSYHEFLHNCLKEELSDKEEHTLKETQEAFKKCVLKWKKR